MSKHREFTLGQTVLGRPIEAIHFLPPGYATRKPPVVLFGGIHGDEPSSVLILQRLCEELLERPPGRDTFIIPCVNVDGTLAGSKNNANDVDLNRNFAAANWVAKYEFGYNPGKAPEDQPEAAALAALIAKHDIHRLIAVHATFRVMNWDGSGQPLAEQMGQLAGYPASGDIGYPTPGSFGSKYGLDQGREVVTVEVPYLAAEEQAWLDTRAAMRFAVDLPT